MTMERNEVSLHEVKVVRALRANEAEWLTSAAVAERASVASRTARSHLLRLVTLGLVDQMELFPAHRYRWSSKALQRNKAYLQRIDAASKVLLE